MRSKNDWIWQTPVFPVITAVVSIFFWVLTFPIIYLYAWIFRETGWFWSIVIWMLISGVLSQFTIAFQAFIIKFHLYYFSKKFYAIILSLLVLLFYWLTTVEIWKSPENGSLANFEKIFLSITVSFSLFIMLAGAYKLFTDKNEDD